MRPGEVKPAGEGQAAASLVRARTTPRELVLFALGAAPLLLTTAAAAVAAFLVPVSSSVDAWVQVAFGMGISTLAVSAGVGLWLVLREKTRRVAAVLFWCFGLGVSVPLVILVTAVMIALLGSVRR